MTDKLTWTNSTRKLSELIPWPINPAQIGKDEARRLEESLEEFGQVQTIAISPTNEIYDGHQRQTVWGASRKFGMDYVVDVRVSSRELTEQERKKLVIFLRKGTVGEFDWDVLANNFETSDLLEWGFTEKELSLDSLDDSGLPSPGSGQEKGIETICPKCGFKYAI
jgi:ParB-like chromosome segregation protein Spo0J